ncbi:MAG TPA: ABC transporter permease [Myxococcota bacterium]|jgi:phospholipid/cholesterol/gamma-HCH transport system permease protein|nr:ABC transporter permease [Myxococcota bacterium]
MARAAARAEAAATLQQERAGDTLVLRLAGRLDAPGTAALWADAVGRAESEAAPRLVVDAARVDYCDGSGFALLSALEDRQRSRGAAFELGGLREELARIYTLVRPPATVAPAAAPAAPQPRGFFESFGRSVFELDVQLRALVTYTGELTAALFWAATHPRRVRWRDVLRVASQAGSGALPIICLVGFLMGLIMAFQSVVQLRWFAAEIFTADAVGLTLIRELGALMTAVILAGRSGSAFAAELGTMKVNEELDALTTMGLFPVRFLVVTRVLAGVAVTPFLICFFNLAGLFGGLVVLMGIGYPPITFYRRVTYMVDLNDLFGGLFKGFVFGILVTAIGCLRGLETRQGARAVGESATSAVVSGIVLIAVADGILSVIYYVLEI